MNLNGVELFLGGESGLDPHSFSPLALAYIGDAVFEVLVRLTVMTDGNAPVNRLHKKARNMVNAKATVGRSPERAPMPRTTGRCIFG